MSVSDKKVSEIFVYNIPSILLIAATNFYFYQKFKSIEAPQAGTSSAGQKEIADLKKNLSLAIQELNTQRVTCEQLRKRVQELETGMLGVKQQVTSVKNNVPLMSKGKKRSRNRNKASSSSSISSSDEEEEEKHDVKSKSKKQVAKLIPLKEKKKIVTFEPSDNEGDEKPGYKSKMPNNIINELLEERSVVGHDISPSSSSSPPSTSISTSTSTSTSTSSRHSPSSSSSPSHSSPHSSSPSTHNFEDCHTVDKSDPIGSDSINSEDLEADADAM